MSSKKAKILESAQKNFLKGLYDKSILEYRQLIQLDPSDIKLRQRLAEILTKVNKKDEAISEYTALAKHYIDSVHYLKAIAVYKQIQKLDPTNPEISLTLASLNEKQGLIGNATAEYAAAIRIFEAKGEHLKALKALESILALEPDNYAVRLRVAEKNFSVGKEEQAGNDFVAIARDLREKNDENGFSQVSGKIRLLFGAQAAALFSRINEGFEPETQADLASAPPPQATLPQPAKAVAPEMTPKPAQTAKPVFQPGSDTTTMKRVAAIEPPVVVEDLEVLEEIEELEEVEVTEEIEALEELEAAEEFEPLEEIEAAEEIESLDELETAEALEENETTAELEELPSVPESADWEEEIDLEAIAASAAATPALETDFDAAAEQYGELEELELELEIDDDELLIPASFSDDQPVTALPTTDAVPFDLGDHLPDFSDATDAGQPDLCAQPADALPDTAAVTFDFGEHLPDFSAATDADQPESTQVQPADTALTADAVSFSHEDLLPDFDAAAEPSDHTHAQSVETLPEAAAGSFDHGNLQPDFADEAETDSSDLAHSQSVDRLPDAAAVSVEAIEEAGAVQPDSAHALSIDTLRPPDDADSFDLGSDLSIFADEIDFNLGKSDANFDLDSPSGFTKLELDNEDAESHYSLGLAYREMGLFNEAISEFIVASHSPERKVDCLILQGGCLREIGLANKALDILDKALQLPGLDEDKILGIKYELAVCHEAMDNKKLAKQLYREILTTRPDFSDTAARFSKL